MLEVLPIQDKQEQELLCARCEIPFHGELMAYKALVDGELKGVCQFTMDQNGGRILHFAHVPNAYEFEPMFVMGRATLNFIDLCGVHTAFFDADYDNEVLIKAVGFRKNGRQRMMLYLFDQMDQFLGRCLAAGFFFHSLQNMQIKTFRKVGEAIMEGDQFATVKVCQSLSTVGL